MSKVRLLVCVKVLFSIYVFAEIARFESNLFLARNSASRLSLYTLREYFSRTHHRVGRQIFFRSRHQLAIIARDRKTERSFRNRLLAQRLFIGLLNAFPLVKEGWKTRRCYVGNQRAITDYSE